MQPNRPDKPPKTSQGVLDFVFTALAYELPGVPVSAAAEHQGHSGPLPLRFVRRVFDHPKLDQLFQLFQLPRPDRVH